MSRYKTVSDHFLQVFGHKVRKIAVDAGLGCPSRCSYCNNASFSPSYARSVSSVSQQLERGVGFFASKGPVEGYLAYFQSYTGTFGSLDRLVELYEEALAFPGVEGLVVATRPDCIGPELLDWMGSRFVGAGKPYLLVEIGVESTLDGTLFAVRRGHTYECASSCIRELARRGIDVGAHLIIGLPGETESDFLLHARRMSELPIKTLKLHQLQIIRGTAMARQYEMDSSFVHLFSASEYASVISRMLPLLRPDIALDRFVSESPRDMVIAPCWGLKPSEFAMLLENYLQ